MTAPSAVSSTFELVNKEIPVYVPEGSVEAYKAAEGCKDFTNIQAKKSTGVGEITKEDEA